MRHALLLAVLEVPVGVAYVLVAGVMAFCAWRLWAWSKAARDLNAQYVAPPGEVPIRVRVRGPEGAPVPDLEHFRRCWVAAFDQLAQHGPWTREELIERLNAGNKVQVMESDRWPRVGSPVDKPEMVGGELVVGVLRVGPSLDVLCHELIHRCEEVLDPSRTADGSHVTWQGRGLRRVDEGYRAWLAALPI